MAFAISLGLFSGSLSAIVFMLVRKRPALRNLALKEEVQRTVEDAGLVSGGRLSLFKDHISASRFWQSGVMVAIEKMLRKFRLGFLKAECRIGSWIESLRQRKENDTNGVTKKRIPEKRQSSYLSWDAQQRERNLIERIAHNPKSVTNYKELGFLYLQNGLDQYACETFKMAVRLGSKDRQIAKALERLSSEES